MAWKLGVGGAGHIEMWRKRKTLTHLYRPHQSPRVQQYPKQQLAQTMIQEVLQRFTSTPVPEADESDYEVSVPSISHRVVSNRRSSNVINTSTPKRTRATTPSKSQNLSPLTMVSTSYSRSVSPLKHQAVGQADPMEERQKIREFVDVRKMITALRTLETLVSTPDVDYEDFKSGYVESTNQLFSAMSPEAASSLMSPLVAPDATVSTKSESNKDIMVGIFMVSAQIFRLCLELGTPLLVSLVTLWKEMMKTPFVMQFTQLAGEIVLISLSVFLELLKKVKEWVN